MSEDVIPSAVLGTADPEVIDGRPSTASVRDRAGSTDRERALQCQRDELYTLNRINGLLFELARDLFGAPTRQDIERTVCDRLAASELYEFAWIGEPTPDSDRIVPRIGAGIDDGYIESVTIGTDGVDTDRGPGGRAFRTGDVQVSQDIDTDPTFESWRTVALERDVRSAAAVPLVHDGTVYAVLAVYAGRPLAFGRREQDAFEILGEAVGFAIRATKTRRLLFADTVLELELRLADADLFLVRHSERFDCELSVEGYVTTTSGGWLLYVSVRGTSPTTVRDAAAADTTVEHVQVVRGGPEGGLVEYRFEESRLLQVVSGAGAKLSGAHAVDGVCRIVVEAPRNTDVRGLMRRIRGGYPRAKLLAKREFDRAVADVGVPDGPLDRLTDRQREVLEAAYWAGYFDWPRASTAEEVAESLGISSPTLHRHLRRAEKQLYTAFFDGGESVVDRTA